MRGTLENFLQLYRQKWGPGTVGIPRVLGKFVARNSSVSGEKEQQNFSQQVPRNMFKLQFDVVHYL